MKRTLAIVTFILAGALALAGLAADAKAQPAGKPRVIRIGVAFVGIGNRPFMGGNSVGIAHARGALEQEFKKDGITIDWSFFQGAGPAVNEAIANGLIDFAWQGDLPAIIGKAGGLRTKVLLASGVRSDSYIAVPADSPINSIEELRGKRVAIFKGTNIQLAANRILEGHGLKERDLKMINMNQATMLAALATKDIDAAIGSYVLLQPRDQGIVKIIYSTKKDSPTYLRQTHFLVVEEFEAKQPDIVQRVVNVLVQTAAWMSEEKNRDAQFVLFAKSGTPYGNYKEDFRGDSVKVRNSPLFDEYLTARYKAALEDARKYGLVRRGFDVDAWIDRRYLNKALSEQHLESYWPQFDASGSPKLNLADAGKEAGK
jgi:sulfonate transport system substrate-binding protein